MVWFKKSKTLICSHLMKKNRNTYTFIQKASSVFLMLTLLWLTVSTPFVVAAQQELAKQQKGISIDSSETCNGDETNNSGNNNIEEKVPQYYFVRRISS